MGYQCKSCVYCQASVRWRPSQYGTGTEALRGDTHCVHTVSAPEARRILAERPPVTRADCERAGGVAHSLARVSPVSCTGYRLLQRSILHRNPFLVLRPAGRRAPGGTGASDVSPVALPRRAPGGTRASDFPPVALPRRAPGGTTQHSRAAARAAALLTCARSSTQFDTDVTSARCVRCMRMKGRGVEPEPRGPRAPPFRPYRSMPYDFLDFSY